MTPICFTFWSIQELRPKELFNFTNWKAGICNIVMEQCDLFSNVSFSSSFCLRLWEGLEGIHVVACLWLTVRLLAKQSASTWYSYSTMKALYGKNKRQRRTQTALNPIKNTSIFSFDIKNHTDNQKPCWIKMYLYKKRTFLECYIKLFSIKTGCWKIFTT